MKTYQFVILKKDSLTEFAKEQLDRIGQREFLKSLVNNDRDVFVFYDCQIVAGSIDMAMNLGKAKAFENDFVFSNAIFSVYEIDTPVNEFQLDTYTKDCFGSGVLEVTDSDDPNAQYIVYTGLALNANSEIVSHNFQE